MRSLYSVQQSCSCFAPKYGWREHSEQTNVCGTSCHLHFKISLLEIHPKIAASTRKLCCQKMIPSSKEKKILKLDPSGKCVLIWCDVGFLSCSACTRVSLLPIPTLGLSRQWRSVCLIIIIFCHFWEQLQEKWILVRGFFNTFLSQWKIPITFSFPHKPAAQCNRPTQPYPFCSWPVNQTSR